MRLDLSGAQIFIDYLAGAASGDEVLEHPAYRAVCLHSQMLRGLRLTAADIDKGLETDTDGFYGLAGARESLPDIRKLMEFVSEHAAKWFAGAERVLERIVPGESTETITVYPIIGYDVGIGLEGSVCINLNARLYREHPREFAYVMAHEAFHVIYSRVHGLPRPAELKTPSAWVGLLDRMLQDEGLATYTALTMRQEAGEAQASGHPLLDDYAVLADPRRAADHARALREVRAQIETSSDLTWNQAMEMVFGPRRLTYRAGCHLAHLIETTVGRDALRAAVYLGPPAYVSTHGHLIGIP